MEILYRWIDGINDVLWSYLLVALLLGCAVWFTLRRRGVQFRMLGEMVRVLAVYLVAQQRTGRILVGLRRLLCR